VSIWKNGPADLVITTGILAAATRTLE